MSDTDSAEAIAPSRDRRRAEQARCHRIQGSRQGRSRRRLSELCDRLCRLARPRRSRPSTTRRCAISSSICTGCSIPRRPARGRRADRAVVVCCRCGGSTRSYRVQRAIGVAAAHYLRFVWQTTRFSVEPPDAIERIAEQVPIILAMWHGQHFLTPFIRPQGSARQGADLAPSRRRDQRRRRRAARHRHHPRLGHRTARILPGKGGVFAFNAAVRALRRRATALR